MRQLLNWLCQNNLNPKIEEDKSSGGTDFICNYKSQQKFVVEVTNLGRKELTEATGCHMIPGQPMFYDLPTEMVRQRVSVKASQLSGYDMPRILIIASLHDGAYLLLGSEEAENFLVSKWAWTFPVGGSFDETHCSTDLKESIFFSFDKKNPEKLKFRRQSISAVLFMAIAGNLVSITGILHPMPAYPLDIKNFPEIPFIKIKNDIIQDREIFTEWTNTKPHSAVFPLSESINKED